MSPYPDSLRGRLVHARPTNPWTLLWARLALWTALSALAGLTPVAFPDAPAWIWPLTLVACLLMAGRTAGVMWTKKGAAPPRRDRVVLVLVLVVFGALSAWLLPDDWRLASLPVALICATIAQRYVAGRRGEETSPHGHE
ncbi:hypothetical protein PV396_41245 [Streptomyces sp. ME02-8801-2C]|uniref:hypothetical protein n=1 Tax=Streptomyces sp. ME02-8801-2C TaxID=3028680 RepID=UPI0029B8D558|nr:hypothetical protein [Streptomyces sp. ME02-8801-2C]MDX3458293.1 hypothetical protein [Streptomyces sp. ME02-8801-2C]